MCIALCKRESISLQDRKVVLRIPKMSDVKTMLAFINSLVAEDAQILVNKKSTPKEEKAWLVRVLGRVRKNKMHIISAFYGKECIGSVTLEKGMWRESHVGTLGLAVKQNFRGFGLGTLLLKKIIAIAERDSGVRVLSLKVQGMNKAAQKLYRKLGFKTVAKLPNRSLYKGKYQDEYVMDYPLRKIS
ncbi:MAG: GNAT family N-acetyltransferase [Candidatus Wildermuthbacteria bacterium]|nr:GNAT family N-acetyltransferase [Candidatus Wildermuthbacteria bacterium]